MPARSDAVGKVRQPDQLAAGQVHQDRASAQAAGGKGEVARPAGPDRVEEIEVLSPVPGYQVAYGAMTAQAAPQIVHPGS